MRKIAALLLALALALTGLTGAVFAEETETETTETAAPQPQLTPEQQEDYREAAAVLELLTGAPVLDGETVSRIQFLGVLAQMTQLPEASNVADYFFADVKSFTEFGNYVYAAYDQGWISRAEYFEPDREITSNEALKLTVNGLGYGIIAEARGGFPAGYLSVARTLNLTDGISATGDETLTPDEARLLLLNALRAPSLEKTVYGDKEQFNTRDTLLKRTYDMDVVEGIVSRTEFNTLTDGEEDGMGAWLEVDGVTYRCNGASSYDMLGVECRVFVQGEEKDGTREAVYVRPLADKKVINLQDVEARTGQRLFYWDDGDTERSASLATGCIVVYNGRRVTENLSAYFAEGAGEVILADNGNDRTYDVVFINRYSYLTSMLYDSYGEMLRDKNGAKWSLNLNQTAYQLLDEAGAALDPFDVADGDVFQVIRSADGGFFQAQRTGLDVSGTVNRIDGNEIYIENVPYYMSDYFKENFLSRINLSSAGNFKVTQDGVIISAVVAAGTMSYGYLVKAAWRDELERRLEVRIFTQSGVMEDHKLRRKLTLDGESGATNDEAYEKMLDGGAFKPQLVRFSVNGEGEINALDFATTTPPQQMGVYPDSKNQLTRYTYTGELTYKSNLNSFGYYCTLVGSVVFVIPDDLNDEENFAIRNANGTFTHDSRYSPEIYDLSEAGAAGAVVCYGAAAAYRINPDNASMVVAEVRQTLNSEGEFIYAIYGWYNGSFTTVYLEPETAVDKSAANGITVNSVHPILCGGDIIRYVADGNGIIKSIDVIFDARIGVFDKNAKFDSNFNIETGAAPMFRKGMVYSKDSSFAALSDVRNANGYNFSPENLRYASISTTGNIVVYDAETGEVRPITANDIRTYKTDGQDAHYAVFCQSSFATKTIVLYERTEARQ